MDLLVTECGQKTLSNKDVIDTTEHYRNISYENRNGEKHLKNTHPTDYELDRSTNLRHFHIIVKNFDT